MKTYRATFYGRQLGAIGSFYPIYDFIDADNEEKARIKLYDKYDHITRLTLKEVEKNDHRS